MTRTWLIWLAVVNPARAGMIPIECRTKTLEDCKPRASGDDPAHLNEVAKQMG